MVIVDRLSRQSLSSAIPTENVAGSSSRDNRGDGMGKRHQGPTGASDTEVRGLLDRYGCPTPFHAVRTRFLGNIASPVLGASPLDQVKALWDGELPEFDDVEAANELV